MVRYIGALYIVHCAFFMIAPLLNHHPFGEVEVGCDSRMSRPGYREAFYSLFWLGQGVTRVGILCPFFYVLYFYVLAWYGSQSGTAVYRCL